MSLVGYPYRKLCRGHFMFFVPHHLSDLSISEREKIVNPFRADFRTLSAGAEERQTGMKKKAQVGLRLLYVNVSGYSTMRICTSSSCFCSTAEGAPIMTSCAFLFMGKGMISRMESSPASSMTIRSTPGAMPAWGGAP